MITHDAGTKVGTEAVDAALPLTTRDGAAFVSTGGLRRVSLSVATARPPAIQKNGRYYESGTTHVLEGPSGSGKSFVALADAANLIRDGRRVTYLDLENGRRIVDDRMKSLGLTDAELVEYFGYYEFPYVDAAELLHAVEVADPALVVFDSLTGFLSQAGVNENDNAAVKGWFDAYAAPIRNRGSNVLILDHVTKRGGESRGAGSKVDAVDVRFGMVKSKEFDRHKAGEIRFTLKKDREAALPKRVLTYEVGGTPCIFRPGRALTDNERKALYALEDGFTATEWAKASGIPNSSFYAAMKKLVEAELVYADVMRYYRTA